MDKEIQPEEALLLDWTTAIEALDFPIIQELYKEKPDLLWTPLQPSSHLEADFAHFIDRLKKFEILGDNIRPLYALHHILLDYGLSEDEWALERSEIVDFFLEASTAIQLNNFFWGSEQNTILHLAYFIQQPNLVKKLLEKGALPSIPNKSGHLPEQKMDPVIIEEEPQPQLLKTNQQMLQKDERKAQNVSDRFKRLRELAESPNVKKPLSERQNSTRRYFRPGHIEERRRKVLTEEELELEKQKQKRQKEVEMLAQRSAVKNNPLFKKFEQQQPTNTAPKSTGPSGNVASAIKSRQALLDGDQIRRNSRVISSLKDRSVVSTSVFRQQQQSESLKVPTLNQLRAASPTFKKSSLNEDIAESDSDSDDGNTESVKDIKDTSTGANTTNKEDSAANNVTLSNDKPLLEDNDIPKAGKDRENTMPSNTDNSSISSNSSIQSKKETGKTKTQESENANPVAPLSVGKLAALNLSAESIKQKKFSGIISNNVKNIINVHEHLNDKEDVEIEVLGKKFAVWKNDASGDEVQDKGDDKLSKVNISTTITDTDNEAAKITSTISSSSSTSTSSSSSTTTSEEQISTEKDIIDTKGSKKNIEAETTVKNSNKPTFNFSSTSTDNEILSEKSGDSRNILNLNPHKTVETDALGASTTGTSVKQIGESFSSFSEESLVDSLLVGNRDSSSNSFLKSQSSTSADYTNSKDAFNKVSYNTTGDIENSLPKKNIGLANGIQKADINSDNKIETIENYSSLQSVDIKPSFESGTLPVDQNIIDSTSFESKSISSSQINGGSLLSGKILTSAAGENTENKSRNADRELSFDDDDYTSISQNNNSKNNLYNVNANQNGNSKINSTYKETMVMSDEEDFVDPHIQQLMKNNSVNKIDYNNKSFNINPVNVELANAKKSSYEGNKMDKESIVEDSDEDEATTPTMATIKKFEFSNNQKSSIQNSNDYNQPRSIITQNQTASDTKATVDSSWETAYNDLLSSKDIDFEDDIPDDKSDTDNLYSSRTSVSSDADEKNIIDKLSSDNMNSFNKSNGKWSESKTKSHPNRSNTENEENPHQGQLITEDQTKDGKLQTNSFLSSSRPDSEAVEYSVNKVQIIEMYPSTSSVAVTSNEGKRASGSQRNHWSTGINLMGAVLKRESIKLDRQSIAASSEAGSEQWFDPDDDWASQDESYRRSIISASAEKYNENAQYPRNSDDPTLDYYEEKHEDTTHQKVKSSDMATNDYYYKQSDSHENSYYHNQSHDNTPQSEYFKRPLHNRTSDSSTASESSSYKNSNSTQNTSHEDYDYKASYIDDNEETMDYYTTKLHNESPVTNESVIQQNNIEYTHQHANRGQFQVDSDNEEGEEGEGEIVVFMDQTHSNNHIRPDSDYDIDGKLGRMEFQSMGSTEEEFKTIDIQNASSSQRSISESREAARPESPVVPLSPVNNTLNIGSSSGPKPEIKENIPATNEHTKFEESSTTRVINDNSSNKFELPDDDDTPSLPHDPNKPRVEDISRYMNTLPAVENAYVEHDVQKQRISKKPSADEQINGDRGIPNAHEINFDVLPDSFKDRQLNGDTTSQSKISLSSTEASNHGKMYIGVSGAHNMLLPLPKEITYVRCVISDGEYEYMSRYEILGPQILMDYECIVDTRPGMIITVSLHVRPDYHVKPRTGWSRWFTSIRKQKEHLSGYVHPDDGAIGQTRFAVDHMVPACHKKTYEANFDCFNSWYARTNRERARREQYGDEEDILKIVGKLTVEMLYLPVSSPSVQVPRSLRECDLTLKIRQWHSTSWHSGYLSTRCQGLKVWERRYYRLIGSQLVGYESELDEVEKQVWDRYNIADVIRLSAAADKVIISLVEEEDPDKIFKPESIHDENNKGFFRLSFSDFYLDCVSDDANESEEWVKTLKSMIGRVPLRLPFTN